MHHYLKALVAALTMIALASTFSPRSSAESALNSSDWMNGDVTITKLSDHTWVDGDQYRYGNIPCVYMSGYRWGVQTNGWSTGYPKTTSTQCATTGVGAYIGFEQVMPFDSPYWQQLDFTGYPNFNTFPNRGTNGLALITNVYGNYSGAPHELYYTPDVLNLFSVFTKDFAGNVVRHPNGQFERKLTYPDGRPVSMSTTSGISYSANGRWMYVTIQNVGQFRINTDDFSVVSFTDGFSPYYSVYSSIANSGNSIAVYTKDRGLKLYDLTKCEMEKPNYGSRNCASRDVTAQMRDGLKQTLDNPTLLTDFSLLEVKFLNESELRVLMSYRYNNEYKYAFMSLKLSTVEPPTRYLALGDSFSSGEGTFDYIGETNFYEGDNEYNLCHLSDVSYPYLLSKVISTTWFGSVACSGAVSEEVVSEKNDINFINKLSSAKVTGVSDSYIESVISGLLPGYVAQNSMVTHYSPTVATITIGGNDIGFGSIISACITQPGCFSSRNDREQKADEIASKILGMTAKLRTIRESMAGSNPKLYVLGYPSITSYANIACSLIGQVERERLDALENYLNESIKIAAHNAGAIYVDLTSAFAESTEGDHRLCGNTGLAVNGFVPAPNARSQHSTVRPGAIYGAESYHPNAFGHSLLAAKIRALTNDFQLSPNTTANFPIKPDESFYRRFVGDGEDHVSTSAVYSFITQYDTVKRDDSLDVRIRQNSQLLPAVNGTATVELHSDPVTLASITFNPAADTTVAVRIPSSVTAGWHELHVLYTDIQGTPVDLYQYIYVMASESDYDGDGIANGDEVCPVGGSLGIDIDEDGVDDACDALIQKMSQPAPPDNTPEPEDPGDPPVQEDPKQPDESDPKDSDTSSDDPAEVVKQEDEDKQPAATTPGGTTDSSIISLDTKEIENGAIVANVFHSSEQQSAIEVPYSYELDNVSMPGAVLGDTSNSQSTLTTVGTSHPQPTEMVSDNNSFNGLFGWAAGVLGVGIVSYIVVMVRRRRH